MAVTLFKIKSLYAPAGITSPEAMYDPVVAIQMSVVGWSRDVVDNALW